MGTDCLQHTTMKIRMLLMCVLLLCHQCSSQQNSRSSRLNSVSPQETSTSSPPVPSQTHPPAPSQTHPPAPPPPPVPPECQERSTCSNWNKSISQAIQFVSMNCYCDHLCSTYGDCCEDYSAYAADSKQSNKLNIESMPLIPVDRMDTIASESVECTSIYGIDSGEDRIQVVNRCPHSWPQENAITQQCQFGNSDMLLQWPVSDSDGVLFRNVFCAICHGRQADDILYWKGDFKCENFTQSNPDMSIQKLVEDELYKQYCTRSFIAPDRTGFRKCHQFEQTCPHSFPHVDVLANCLNGPTALVYVWSEYKIYANRFCAQCHNHTSYQCSKKANLFAMGHDGFMGSMYPLSLLLDLNSGFGKYVASSDGESGSKNDGNYMHFMQCAHNEVYDPFTSACRQLGCAHGYVLTEGGQCVLKTSDAWNVGVNDSCVRHILNQTEYTVLLSGEIFINSSNEILSSGEYESRSDGTVLVCTNLTRNYSVEKKEIFMEFNFDESQTIISMIGQIISLVALAINFTVYLLLPHLRNLAGKNLLCLVASLFVGQFFFLFGLGRSRIYELCFFIAVIIHYSFLSSFLWMNVLAIGIYKTFSQSTRSPTGSRRQFVRNSIYAWGVAALFVILAVILDLLLVPSSPINPRYGQGVCWITSRWALVMFFALPVFILVISNTVLYSLTIYAICRITKDTEAVRKSSDQQRLLLYIKLSSIMGLTWLFGFLATVTDTQALWYVFIILNSLQGAFICFAFVCNAKTIRMLKERYAKRAEDKRRESDGTRTTLLTTTSKGRSQSVTHDIANKINPNQRASSAL